MFRKFMLALGAIGASISFANAADMAVKAPVTPAAYNWSGFYLGAQAGGAWSDTKWTNTIGVTTGGFDGTGAVGGLTAGYNWQIPRTGWVVGLEADVSGSSLAPSTNTAVCAGTCRTDVQAFGTLRGRLGYTLFDRSLLYATGGATVASVEYHLTGATTRSETLWGWNIGAGWEYALANRWSMKVEYLYTEFEDGKYSLPLAVITAPLDMQTVRVGLNYRF